MIKIIFFIERLKEYFLIMKNDNKNNAPIINLKEATDTGLIKLTDIFIAMNDENDPRKPLGKWFQPAWSTINIARGEMFEWLEIKKEIFVLAKLLKKTFERCEITHPSIGGARKSNFTVRKLY